MTTAAGHQATTRKARRWEIENWETVSFIPVVGWTNHYSADDGEQIHTPCPGVVTQELRSTTDCWDVPRGDGKFDVDSITRTFDAPFRTRAVAAEMEYGALVPADDVSNYMDTTMPGEVIKPATPAPADESNTALDEWMKNRIVSVLGERGPMTADQIEAAVWEGMTGFPGLFGGDAA